jgi:hypothetical protein
LSPADGPLGNILLHLGYVVVGYTFERPGCTYAVVSMVLINTPISTTATIDAKTHVLPIDGIAQ